jgi:hypothetical protein
MFALGYRTTARLIALLLGNGSETIVHIPAGATIRCEADVPSRPGMVYIGWGTHRCAVFKVDLEAKAIPINSGMGKTT